MQILAAILIPLVALAAFGLRGVFKRPVRTIDQQVENARNDRAQKFRVVR